MIFNQNNVDNLRALFCNAVINIFGNTESFLEFIENEECSDKYDCFIDWNGENYIINRETGEYINWYKFNHIGRSICISVLSNRSIISEWLESFLVEFKGEEVNNMITDKWHKLYDWLNDTRLASAPEPVLGPSDYTVRKVRHDLIDEIMEYMEELEEEEYDET